MKMYKYLNLDGIWLYTTNLITAITKAEMYNSLVIETAWNRKA